MAENGSGSSRIDMIVELLREGRGEMRELSDAIKDLGDRVTKLEAALGAPVVARPSLARDAGVATSAGAVVVAIITALQATGVIRPTVVAASPNQPPAISAPAAP